MWSSFTAYSMISILQLRICPMGYSRKGYIRIGDYVEVRIPKMASYSAVATHAMEMLQLEEEEGERMEYPVSSGLMGQWCQKV